ncbi:MAG: histidinol dehydrogenase [Candidatus Omnitrophota bacterium]
MKLIKTSSKEYNRLCNRGYTCNKKIVNKVSKIIEDIKHDGDKALIHYTRKFDKVKLAPKQLKVSAREVNGAFQDIDPVIVNSLKVIIENVTKFYKKQLKKSWKIKNAEGIILGEMLRPVESVGIYIPSGTAPLVSTVYMTVLPAKVAGVQRIVLVSPPNEYQSINPYILVVANLLGVTEIYKAGGAQAIAALAYGTKTIPKVDKIVGPGNLYVTEAKRQVFGYVDVDMLAGPSEVVVIAGKFSDPKLIAADMAAQAEHFMGFSLLITPSKDIVKAMRQYAIKGYIIKVKNLSEAVDIANSIAPEHLQLMIQNPNKILKNIKNAGAVFLGPYSPTAVGDYIAGPSHVLPTGGTARFSSGLGIFDFLKGLHVISYTKKALENVVTDIERIATLEGLTKHIESIKERFK